MPDVIRRVVDAAFRVVVRVLSVEFLNRMTQM